MWLLSFKDYVRKVVLSPDFKLNPDNYVVAFYAFSIGDDGMTDVVFYKGQVYAIRNCGHEVIHSLAVETFYKNNFVPRVDLGFSRRVYLVESTMGDQFYARSVQTTMRALPHMTRIHPRIVEHIEVKSIGDEANWFVDGNGFWVYTKFHIPQGFVECDMVMFNLQDKTNNPVNFAKPATWIVQNDFAL
ncbi:hypothetical protein DVH24_007183 [Malus domestica]|uniref:Uncharacterized protein n=1 Tax=Malus domestica TaxID=3750 RepID=A0A498HKK5_MALDO|nr:hypothetical protein DVH24_007183 [Malus domestica]